MGCDTACILITLRNKFMSSICQLLGLDDKDSVNCRGVEYDVEWKIGEQLWMLKHEG